MTGGTGVANSAFEQSGMRRSVIHTIVTGICYGLDISLVITCRYGSALEKTKSLGNSERAPKNPTIGTVDKISAAMDAPITPFFTEEQPKADMGSPVISKIHTYLMDMTEEQQRDFLRIIRIFHGYMPKDK